MSAVLRVEALHAGYGRGLVLHGVHLAIEPGELVCLMGRNGVGKTTLLQAIMGLVPSRAGRVWVGPLDVTNAPPHVRARNGVGYVPQGRGVFPELSVMENLQVAAEAVKAPRGAIDDALGVFPSLRTMLGRQAGALSGGQQQQLAFSRALVGRPSLLLLDEPTEGIQPSIILEIEEALDALKATREVAILLVEQYLEFALRLADRACVMDRGMIVVEGAPADLAGSGMEAHLVV